jgi:hypothetical protein
MAVGSPVCRRTTTTTPAKTKVTTIPIAAQNSGWFRQFKLEPIPDRRHCPENYKDGEELAMNPILAYSQTA